MSIWGVGLLLIILLRAYQSLSGDNNVNSSCAFLFWQWERIQLIKKLIFMEDSHFCNVFHYCPMRLDMENSKSKLAFLRENWLDVENYNKISGLSVKYLKCALCVMNIVINAISNEEFYCSNREVIRLINTQHYIQNTYEIHKLQEELQEELEKYKNITSSK